MTEKELDEQIASYKRIIERQPRNRTANQMLKRADKRAHALQHGLVNVVGPCAICREEGR